MTGSAKFKSVPIIDVTKENVAAMGPLVRGAIIGADFIAIDCVSFFMIFFEISMLTFLTSYILLCKCPELGICTCTPRFCQVIKQNLFLQTVKRTIYPFTYEVSITGRHM